MPNTLHHGSNAWRMQPHTIRTGTLLKRKNASCKGFATQSKSSKRCARLWLGGYQEQASRGKCAPRNKKLVGHRNVDLGQRILPGVGSAADPRIAILASGSRKNRCCPRNRTSS